jgi:hypothetical protein
MISSYQNQTAGNMLLKKSKVHNNICDNCLKEFRFYKSRFEKMPDFCFECEPDEYD